MSVDVQKLITEYYAAVNTLDGEQWAARFAPEATIEDPVGAPTLAGGREAFAGFFEQAVAGPMADFNMNPTEIHTAGLEAAVHFAGSATAKNGKEGALSGISFFKFNGDGLIVSLRAFWDAPAFLAQIQ